MTRPTCIECGQRAFCVTGDTIYPSRTDLHKKYFYRCKCGAYCGCHAGTRKSLGTPCGPQTRRMRMAAHEEFDKIWKGEPAYMTRGQAYEWLAGLLGKDTYECHIGRMNALDAGLVVVHAKYYLETKQKEATR